MKILRTRKLKSCVSFYCEAEQEEIDAIVIEGLQRFAKESGFPNIKVIPASEFTARMKKMLKRAKQHELTSEEQQYLLNIGFCSILCDNISKPFPSLDTFDAFPLPRKSKAA